MTRHATHLTACLIAIALPALTAQAQHHGIPNVAGIYNTFSPEHCTVSQDRDVVWVSASTPGVATFQMWGKYGVQAYTDGSGRTLSVLAFHGHYAVTYDDGHPTVTGVASLASIDGQRAGMRYYESRGGALFELETKPMTRIRQLHSTPGARPVATRAAVPTARPASQPRLADDYDQFQLMPSDIGDLGL